MDKAAFLKELADYVAIESVSAQPAHAQDCRRSAEWVAAKLKSLGMSVELVETGGHPLVMGTYRVEGNAPHVVVYGHHDVQPVDTAKESWKSPPFTLSERSGGLWARGVADNKGPTLALIYGLAAALKKKPQVNITCLIEGEEEIGSKHLVATLEKLAPRLGPVDAIVLSDTTSHSPKQLCVTTGTRGIMGFDIHVTALARDLHSGNGGPVPNAARELARVVALLFDNEGRVTLPGFYDGMLIPNAEQVAGLKATNSQKNFATQHGNRGFYPLAGTDPFVANRFWPSLEVNGIHSGYDGEGSKTIIPAKAFAKITCRIAPGQDHEKFAKTVVAGVEALLDKTLFESSVDFHKKPMPAYSVPVPHLGGDAAGTPPSFKAIFQAVHDSVKAVTGNAPMYVSEGASIPVLPDLSRILKTHAIMLGLAGEDSAMHSPDEKADIEMLSNGSDAWQKFFETVGGV